jgi:hypothetical protein
MAKPLPQQPVDKATDIAAEMGLSYPEASKLAQRFISSVRDELNEKEEKAAVEIHVSSLDKKAGEIIIKFHGDRSSRTPDEVLKDVLERYDKDPDKWAIVKRMKNGRYVGKPKKRSEKKTSSRSKSKNKTSSEPDLDSLSPEQAEALLNKLTGNA